LPLSDTNNEKNKIMKTIKPSSILEVSAESLAALSAITGKTIHAQTLPFMGRVVCYDGKRHCERLAGDLPSDENFEVSMQENCDTKEVARFFIGSKHHGPVMSIEVRDEHMEFYNCFAKTPGGWGNNCSHGGTWSGQASFRRDGERGVFTNFEEALDNRHNPELTLGGEIGVAKLKFRESAEFVAALRKFLSENI
jgi:hypothetical protein